MKWQAGLDAVQDGSGDLGDLQSQRGGHVPNACLAQVSRVLLQEGDLDGVIRDDQQLQRSCCHACFNADHVKQVLQHEGATIDFAVRIEDFLPRCEEEGQELCARSSGVALWLVPCSMQCRCDFRPHAESVPQHQCRDVCSCDPAECSVGVSRRKLRAQTGPIMIMMLALGGPQGT